MATKSKVKNRNRGLALTKAHTAAIRQHIDALRDHASALFVAAAASRATTGQQIISVLAHQWGVSPQDISEAEPISDYLTGGPGYLVNYRNVLNSLFPGLQLTPGDMRGIKKVKDMVDVIQRGLAKKSTGAKP